MSAPSDVRVGTGREPTRRLFFALWPDEAMQAALVEATRAIVAASDGVPVPNRNLHLTLAFLGAVPESRIAELQRIGAQVATSFRSVAEAGSAVLTVRFDGIAHWRKSQVLCATASEAPGGIAALSAVLSEALTAAGFAPDLKPFRAHATLARKVRRVTRERNMHPVQWSFRDLRLVESRTEPSGAVYSSCEIWPLYATAR